MAEQFIKLTNYSTNEPVWIRVSAVRSIASGNGDGASLCFADSWHVNVKESPSEVLALLSPSGSPAGGALDEVRDVIELLRARVKDGCFNDEFRIYGVTGTHMRRLLEWYDKLNTR